MAIIPENEYPGKVNPANADYPYGEPKNVVITGDRTGTPWEEKVVKDIFGFQQALLVESNITPTGSPETAQSSQYLEAIKTVLRPSQTVAVAKTGKQFVSIQSAIDSITDASASKMYVIEVYPGVYEENIVLKDYIGISARGGRRSVEIYSTTGTALTLPANYTTLNGVFIHQAAISSSNILIDATAGSGSTGFYRFDQCDLNLTCSAVGAKPRLIVSNCGTGIIFTDTIADYVLSDTSATTGSYCAIDIESGNSVFYYLDSVLRATTGMSGGVFVAVGDSSSGETLLDSNILSATTDNASFGGVAAAVAFYGSAAPNVPKQVSDSEILVSGTGGTGSGFGIYIDSTTDDCVLRSVKNGFSVTGYSSNARYNIGSGDYVKSIWCHDYSDLDSDTVAGTIKQFDSRQSDGNFKVIGDADFEGDFTIKGNDVDPSIDSIASLRASGYFHDIYVKGHTTAGDGGEGHFRYVSGAAASTYTDDNGTVIVPTGGDGSAAWLRQYSGAVNVKWFGATGDGVTDDSTSIKAAWHTVVEDAGAIFFPIGTYIITEHNIFGKFNLVGLYGPSIIGESKMGSIISFQPSSGNTSDSEAYLYDGYLAGADYSLGRITVKDINISCYNPNTLPNVGLYRQYSYTGVPNQNFVFINCRISGPTNCIMTKLVGTVNNSENKFDHCTILYWESIMEIENAQAVNQYFNNCDIEVIFGDFFIIKGGGNVVINGGSMIFDSTASGYFFSFPTLTAPSVATVFSVIGVRYELRSANCGIVKITDKDTYATINFRDTDFNEAVSDPGTRTLFDIVTDCKTTINIDGCKMIDNMAIWFRAGTANYYINDIGNAIINITNSDLITTNFSSYLNWESGAYGCVRSRSNYVSKISTSSYISGALDFDLTGTTGRRTGFDFGKALKGNTVKIQYWPSLNQNRNGEKSKIQLPVYSMVKAVKIIKRAVGGSSASMQFALVNGDMSYCYEVSSTFQEKNELNWLVDDIYYQIDSTDVEDRSLKICCTQKLDYTSQTANFTLYETVTGGTSGATGIILADSDSGTTGSLTIYRVSGIFSTSEIITDGGGGSATLSTLTSYEGAGEVKNQAVGDIFYVEYL